MAGLLAELVPFALALAVTPTAIAAGILFLSSERPVANDLAFAAPFVAVYGVLSGIVLVASGASSGPLLDDHDKAVTALAVGVVLLALALVNVVRQRRTGMPRKAGLVARIATATPAEAFEIGTVVAVLNPNIAILLGALAAVAATDVPLGTQVAGAAVLVVASIVGVAGPLLWYVLRRESARRGLAQARAWLGRHEHAVNVGVLVVFGACSPSRAWPGCDPAMTAVQLFTATDTLGASTAVAERDAETWLVRHPGDAPEARPS